MKNPPSWVECGGLCFLLVGSGFLVGTCFFLVGLLVSKEKRQSASDFDANRRSVIATMSNGERFTVYIGAARVSMI